MIGVNLITLKQEYSWGQVVYTSLVLSFFQIALCCSEWKVFVNQDVAKKLGLGPDDAIERIVAKAIQ